ncbi:MAG: acyl-CoA dehydrogenase family protein [Pseudomonadota bacterium]
MKFEFSEDQELLRDQARKFLQDKCAGAVVRGVLESDQTHDDGLWREIAEMGWTGVVIPEEHGGLGLGYLELCVIAEELGRALAPVPFSSSIYFAAEALMQDGSSAQKAAWLPKLASGEVVGALALAEGPGATPFSKTKTKAQSSGNGQFRISGVKGPVLDGMAADIAIVPALGEDGFGLYLVALDQNGVERAVEPSLDESRPQARIAFDNAVAEKIGDSGEASLRYLLNKAAVLFAFEQLGGADACLQMGVAYAKERFAFGRPIGSFQAIKHRLADMYAELELARSNCFYAAWALSTDDVSLAEAAAVARISISAAYFTCAKENIQVHGGIGFTWDLDAHLYYRREKLLSSVIGGQRRWREYLVQALENKEMTAADENARVA